MTLRDTRDDDRVTDHTCPLRPFFEEIEAETTSNIATRTIPPGLDLSLSSNGCVVADFGPG